jgi:hypothetical protein
MPPRYRAVIPPDASGKEWGTALVSAGTVIHMRTVRGYIGMRFFGKAMAAAAILCVSGLAAHAGDQDFTLYNETGYTIDQVYVSPVSKSTWGNDIMGSGQLEAGSKVDINFKNSTSACHWDLKVVYEDKDEATWNDLNLCDISNIHLHWDRKGGTTRATTD